MESKCFFFFSVAHLNSFPTKWFLSSYLQMPELQDDHSTAQNEDGSNKEWCPEVPLLSILFIGHDCRRTRTGPECNSAKMEN